MQCLCEYQPGSVPVGIALLAKEPNFSAKSKSWKRSEVRDAANFLSADGRGHESEVLMFCWDEKGCNHSKVDIRSHVLMGSVKMVSGRLMSANSYHP